MKVYRHQSRPRTGSGSPTSREQLGGVPFTRVAAVDGTKIPETTRGLTRFELACLASHRDAWRRFLATSQGARLLSRGRPAHLAGLRGARGRRRLGSVRRPFGEARHLFPEGEARRPRPVAGGREVARLYSRHESSAAYLLSRAGAERYLELTDPPTLPADYSLFPKNARRLGLRIYQLTPAVAIQDHLRPPPRAARLSRPR